MNKFNTNMLTLLSGFTFLNKIDDLRNIQILEVNDAASIMQDLMMHVSMILQIMHISLMHISMMRGGGILSVTEEMEKRDCYSGILGV